MLDAAVVTVLCLGLAGCGHRDVDVAVRTPGPVTLLVHRPFPKDESFPAVAEAIRLAVVGGRHGCVGYHSDHDRDVVVIFPPDTTVISGPDGPVARIGHRRYRVGSRFVGGPADVAPVPMRGLRLGTRVPAACRGLDAQAFYSVL